MSLEILNTPKVPTTSDHHVGIEIEFITDLDIMSVKKLILDLNLEYNCSIGVDSSVREVNISNSRVDSYWSSDYRIGYEIRIIAKQSELPKVLDRVKLVLDACKARVNSTCGLHVHLDMRNRDYNKSLFNLYRSQNLLFKMVEQSRRKNKYCKLIRRLESNSHYNGINAKHSYNIRKTIEVRMHHGTIDITEIKRWALTLIKIVDMDLVKVKTVQPKHLPVSKEHLNWIQQRIVKYD